jgi:alkyl sulfatase BDS1-like metallo-beta-lactamase superfamily hydrolase
VPASLENAWHVRGYHGAVKNNTRAVINRYLGFSDLNPTNLMPLSPSDSAPLYVEMMGGADKIMAKGKELYDEGKYLAATEILNKVLYAEPQNQDNKDLLADVFEQIGYQQETPGFRNSFLAAAYELRSGFPEGAAPKASGPDVIRAMSTELFLDFVGIRMDSRLAEDIEFTINLITPDNGEKFIVELSNATLTNIEGYLADDPDLTLTIDRVDLEQVMMGAKSLQSQIEDGTAQIEGNADILAQLAATLVHFDLAFEILPGTVESAVSEDLNEFEVGAIPVTHE